MFFVAGDAARSWGANLPGSPVIAANEPEERATIMMVWVHGWSDGTPGPGMRKGGDYPTPPRSDQPAPSSRPMRLSQRKCEATAARNEGLAA